jgi:NTE family protein
MNDVPTPAALAKQYEQVALVLQGGGALGAYQCGVYQALDEAGIRPDVVAGISIGAINAAIIAGNPPERRLARLTAFWERICTSAHAPFADPVQLMASFFAAFPETRGFASRVAAGRAIIEGQPGFFRPRMPPPLPGIATEPGATSLYDTAALHATLEEMVDFDLLNAGPVRFAVGAVDVGSANFAFFDTADPAHRIDARHVMASGALPPAFAPVEIDGKARVRDPVRPAGRLVLERLAPAGPWTFAALPTAHAPEFSSARSLLAS